MTKQENGQWVGTGLARKSRQKKRDHLPQIALVPAVPQSSRYSSLADKTGSGIRRLRRHAPDPGRQLTTDFPLMVQAGVRLIRLAVALLPLR